MTVGHVGLDAMFEAGARHLLARVSAEIYIFSHGQRVPVPQSTQ